MLAPYIDSVLVALRILIWSLLAEIARFGLLASSVKQTNKQNEQASSLVPRCCRSPETQLLAEGNWHLLSHNQVHNDLP